MTAVREPASPQPAPRGMPRGHDGSGRPTRSLLEPAILRTALLDALRKLDPRAMIRNPVMFVVEIGALLTTIVWLVQALGGSIGGAGSDPAWYTLTVSVWLWLTVIFGNFAEAIAEGRGRAQAATLRAMRSETTARLRDGGTKNAGELMPGDVVVVDGRRGDPGRRHRREGDRVGRRVGDHRRVGAGHPRGRRRPLGRHRRHASALRPRSTSRSRRSRASRSSTG